jgi:hypothetical protein
MFFGWKCPSASYAFVLKLTPRRRKRHEMYLALVPWMKAWFQEREQILPGSVRALTEGLQVEELSSDSVPQRYDTALMDEMVGRLRQR